MEGKVEFLESPTAALECVPTKFEDEEDVESEAGGGVGSGWEPETGGTFARLEDEDDLSEAGGTSGPLFSVGF